MNTRKLPDYAQLIEHRKAGMTNKQISDMYGVENSAVCHALKRHKQRAPDIPQEAGFVTYWKHRGLSHQQIIDKIRKVRDQ